MTRFVKSFVLLISGEDVIYYELVDEEGKLHKMFVDTEHNKVMKV